MDNITNENINDTVKNAVEKIYNSLSDRDKQRYTNGLNNNYNDAFTEVTDIVENYKKEHKFQLSGQDVTGVQAILIKRLIEDKDKYQNAEIPGADSASFSEMVDKAVKESNEALSDDGFLPDETAEAVQTYTNTIDELNNLENEQAENAKVNNETEEQIYNVINAPLTKWLCIQAEIEKTEKNTCVILTTTQPETKWLRY